MIVLNVYLGYSLSEIAEMLEKSPEAIWKRMSRAREKLRRAVMSKSAFAEWNTARDGEKNTMNGRTP